MLEKAHHELLHVILDRTVGIEIVRLIICLVTEDDICLSLSTVICRWCHADSTPLKHILSIDKSLNLDLEPLRRIGNSLAVLHFYCYNAGILSSKHPCRGRYSLITDSGQKLSTGIELPCRHVHVHSIRELVLDARDGNSHSLYSLAVILEDDVGCSILQRIVARIAQECEFENTRPFKDCLVSISGCQPIRKLNLPVALGINLDRHTVVLSRPYKRECIYRLFRIEIVSLIVECKLAVLIHLYRIKIYHSTAWRSHLDLLHDCIGILCLESDLACNSLE